MVSAGQLKKHLQAGFCRTTFVFASETEGKVQEAAWSRVGWGGRRSIHSLMNLQLPLFSSSGFRIVRLSPNPVFFL